MKILVKYIPYTWCELPIYKFYCIPRAIKNLLGNTGKGDWKKIRLSFKIIN